MPLTCINLNKNLLYSHLLHLYEIWALEINDLKQLDNANDFIILTHLHICQVMLSLWTYQAIIKRSSKDLKQLNNADDFKILTHLFVNPS